MTAGVSLPFLYRLDGQVHKVSDARLIRPPGSLPEKDFLTLCQRCGQCMKACPTNVINPALAEGGLAGLLFKIWPGGCHESGIKLSFRSFANLSSSLPA